MVQGSSAGRRLIGHAGVCHESYVEVIHFLQSFSLVLNYLQSVHGFYSDWPSSKEGCECPEFLVGLYKSPEKSATGAGWVVHCTSHRAECHMCKYKYMNNEHVQVTRAEGHRCKYKHRYKYKSLEKSATGASK